MVRGIQMQWPIQLKKKTPLAYGLLGLFAVSIFLSCGDNQESRQKSRSVPPESFTFFELGSNTRLTDSIREDLGKILGRDSIERRSILDLEINFRGFIKTYFPQIDKLNRQLNFPPKERVEHDTVKLMYRYAQKKNSPFDYVELVFSDDTQRPLLFKIEFQVDESDIVNTLKAKYGPPQIINWKEENGQSMFWEKESDLLIVSRVPDQFGRHGFQITIYFVRNLMQMIDIERKEREERERQRAKSGQSAF
jgi:hypothetical protein